MTATPVPRPPYPPTAGGFALLLRAGAAGLVGLAAGAAAPAVAQSLGDAEAGGRLAAIWCSGCHATGHDAAGPVTDATPGFPSIAAMPSTTALSLRVFLQTPHQLMPDLHLSRQETDDLISYILSLRRR